MPKKAFITGVSTGIGLATARALCSKKIQVYGTIRKAEDRQILSSEFPDLFVPIIYDVTDKDGLQAVVAQVLEKSSHLDILINNAGIAVSGPLELLSEQDLDLQLDVNLKSVVRITRAFIPALILSGQGTVINISSVSARFTSPLIGAYSISKYALEAATDAFRRELLPWKVKVYSVQPGPIQTPIWTKAKEEMQTYEGTRYEVYMPAARGLLNHSIKIAEPPEKIARLIARIIEKRPNKVRFLVTGNVLFYKVFLRILPASLLDKLILSRVKIKS